MLKNNNFIKSLSDYYPEDELTAIYFHIMSACFGISRQQLLSETARPLRPTEKRKLAQIVRQLKTCRPVQYIIGHTEFYGMRLAVNESVLIPRPETEELVETVIDTLKKRDESGETPKSPLKTDRSRRIIDFGTGSGCIAIAIAKHLPQYRVYASDISDDALLTAYGNAERNGVRIKFFRQDLFDSIPTHCPRWVGAIVSNPPYIMPSEAAQMQRNVLDHEPRGALFAPADDPLAFYSRICSLGRRLLEPGGLIFFELNPLLAFDIAALVKTYGYGSVKIKKDISGKNRFLIAKKKV
jgi:release factor glutamine methyltransferase